MKVKRSSIAWMVIIAMPMLMAFGICLFLFFQDMSFAENDNSLFILINFDLAITIEFDGLNSYASFHPAVVDMVNEEMEFPYIWWHPPTPVWTLKVSIWYFICPPPAASLLLFIIWRLTRRKKTIPG